MKYFLRISQVLLGLFLIYTGYLNLFPIEFIESRLVEKFYISWYVAPILIRVFIALKFLMGLVLIINLNYKKIPIRFAAFALLIHLFDLTANYIYTSTIVTKTFSELIEDNRTISFTLFIAFFVLSLFLQKTEAIDFKRKWIKIVVSVIVLPLPFIFNPVFPEDFIDSSVNTKETIDANQLKIPAHLKNKKVLLTFYSTHCPYCLNALIKIAVTQKKNDDFVDVYACFLGEEEDINYFIKLANTTVEHQALPEKYFLEICGPSFPRFALVENGTITKRWDARTFNFQALENLKQENQ